jgi:hypothetical protein
MIKTKSDLKKYAEDGVKNARQTLKNSEGDEGPTCSMSHDLGYFEGIRRCLELLKRIEETK